MLSETGLNRRGHGGLRRGTQRLPKLSARMMPAHYPQDACAPLTAEGAEDFAEERKEDILTRDHDDQIK